MSEIANNDERFHKRHSFQGRSVVHGSSHIPQMKTLHIFLECNLVLFHTVFDPIKVIQHFRWGNAVSSHRGFQQGSLLFPKIEFFIKADIRGWSFL